MPDDIPDSFLAPSYSLLYLLALQKDQTSSGSSEFPPSYSHPTPALFYIVHQLVDRSDEPRGNQFLLLLDRGGMTHRPVLVYSLPNQRGMSTQLLGMVPHQLLRQEIWVGRETRCKGRPMLEQREGLHQLVNIEVGMDQRNEWFTRLHLSSPPPRRHSINSL